MTAITDETLMALADGELEPAEAARVREALGRDNDLAARFASFAESRALFSGAASRADDDAVPEHLVGMARRLGNALSEFGRGTQHGSTDVPRPETGATNEADDRARKDDTIAPANAWREQASRNLRRSDRFKAMALAASIALCAGGVLGFALSALRQPDNTFANKVPLNSIAVSPAEAELLFQLASGESRQVPSILGTATANITMVSTHRMEDGSICREFTTAIVGTQQTRVACLRERAWYVHLVVVSSSSGSFTPASGHETADQFIEALGSKGILTGDAERKALVQP
ncbi:anti-sigma factor RsiW [Bradyrhizobium sp. AZCC 1588]|uniref:anti-sigma factor family protein n=1 Tax=unclassified Bradyrhizobium TaxID=2631580 RepID=UPI002FEF937C